MTEQFDENAAFLDAWKADYATLRARTATAHARIDAALSGYTSVLDREDGPAPFDPPGWVEMPPTLAGIRDRLATGAGDRTQLARDIRYLLAEIEAVKEKRS